MRIAKRGSVKAAKVAARQLAVAAPHVGRRHRFPLVRGCRSSVNSQGNSTIKSTETNRFTSSVTAEGGARKGAWGRMSPHRWLRRPPDIG
jgi:hypothetical protein